MRQVLSTALVALVVGSLAGVTASVLAQSPEEDVISPAAVSNINAHRVDGKHAVSAGTSPANRAGKLVATDKAGKLPSNIVDPFWGGIKNIPAGFADGVDDGDTTTSYIAATSQLVPVGSTVALIVSYPVNQDIEVSAIPEGAGLWATTAAIPSQNLGDEIIYRSGGTVYHYLYFKIYDGSPDRLKARITVWNANQVAPAAVKTQVKATFYKGKRMPHP